MSYYQKKEYKTKSHHLNLGAHDIHGNYTTPLAANKKNKYFCPECREDLILRQGKIRAHHFSHKPGSCCGYFNNPSESNLHYEAKHRLGYLLKNKKKICIHKRCNFCRESDIEEITNPFDFKSSGKLIL